MGFLTFAVKIIPYGEVQHFAFFEGRAVNEQIKTGINFLRTSISQANWWVWFLDIETQILEPTKILLRALEP